MAVVTTSRAAGALEIRRAEDRVTEILCARAQADVLAQWAERAALSLGVEPPTTPQSPSPDCHATAPAPPLAPHLNPGESPMGVDADRAEPAADVVDQAHL